MNNEMIWEDVHTDPSLEYPFHCFGEVHSLKDMASYRISQAMWRSYMSSQKTSLWTIISNSEATNRRPVQKLINALKITKTIKEILLQAELTTSTELSNFTSCFGQDLSHSGDDRWMLQIDISWCVWLSNGLIDYHKSAAEMLQSGRLNKTREFLVMSKMCMADKMNASCLRSLPLRSNNINFEKNPLLFYWVCYLKNELNQIPLLANTTLEKTMALSCFKCEEMIGFEYFWLRMTNDDRISTAEKILPNQHFWREEEWPLLERLFSLITQSCSQSLASLSAKYLRRSVCQSHSTRHQLRIWHRFKNQISARDFADIMKGAFDDSITYQDRMHILVIMWDTAEDHHKEYLNQHGAKSIIKKLTRSCVPETSPCLAAFDLAYRILSQQPEYERSKLFKEHAILFTNRIGSLELLQKLLNLCLPDATHQSEFKNTLSRSEAMQESCVSYLQQGRPAALNAKLEWVFSERDPNAINEYKKHILTLMTYKFASKVPPFFASIDKWKKLSDFIDQVYIQDAPSAFQIKRTFIELAKLRQYFTVAKEIVEMVLPVQDLKYLKRKLCDNLAAQFRSYTYWKSEEDGDEILLPRLVSWLCDHDEQCISEFKKSIPHGAILNAFIGNDAAKDFRKGDMSESDLKVLLCRLDAYLRWFVGGDERARQCKLQAIDGCSVDASSIFKKGERFRDIVLNWFCDGDEEVMERFKDERMQSRKSI